MIAVACNMAVDRSAPGERKRARQTLSLPSQHIRRVRTYKAKQKGADSTGTVSDIKKSR